MLIDKKAAGQFMKGKSTNNQNFIACAPLTFPVILALAGLNLARAQDGKTSYASMPPLDQYMVDRHAVIALARTLRRKTSLATPRFSGGRAPIFAAACQRVHNFSFQRFERNTGGH